jgi:tetratricopeptide (TPR) repeat protein
MKSLLSILLAAVLFLPACKQKNIVSEKDYSAYINSNSSSTLQNQLNEELSFWNKRLIEHPNDLASQLKIGGLLNKQFLQTGNINSLHNSDSILIVANQLQSKFGSGVYRSLAANCVTQHKFNQAMQYLDSAAALGDNLYNTKLMQVDVAMELGNLYYAKFLLSQLKDKNSFDYIIRESKLSDKNGDLDNAITLMEKAFDKIKDGNNQELYCWAKSNLGDMYGHANRFKESYNAYLDVLKIKPNYYQCLKGIAWIAFSHDKNTKASKEILSYLTKAHPVPDYYLKLAEIADYENNKIEKEKNIQQFYGASTKAEYGDMYARYNFSIASNELMQNDIAFKIAQNEVRNRPTPESYNLLAWANYKKGNINEAVNIIENKIENKTQEPDVLYSIGIIYANAKKTNKAKQYLKAAIESSFELGPVATKEIKERIKQL